MDLIACWLYVLVSILVCCRYQCHRDVHLGPGKSFVLGVLARQQILLPHADPTSPRHRRRYYCKTPSVEAESFCSFLPVVGGGEWSQHRLDGILLPPRAHVLSIPSSNNAPAADELCLLLVPVLLFDNTSIVRVEHGTELLPWRLCGYDNHYFCFLERKSIYRRRHRRRNSSPNRRGVQTSLFFRSSQSCVVVLMLRAVFVVLGLFSSVCIGICEESGWKKFKIDLFSTKRFEFDGKTTKSDWIEE
jgi:hypothetical protein